MLTGRGLRWVKVLPDWEAGLGWRTEPARDTAVVKIVSLLELSWCSVYDFGYVLFAPQKLGPRALVSLALFSG